MSAREVIFVNRQDGFRAVPLFFNGEWHLLILAGFGPRELWNKGLKRIRNAIRDGELPDA